MYNQIDSNKRKTWALMLGFVIIISALGYFFDVWYGDGSHVILIVAIIFSLFTALFGFFSGDRVALATAGAKFLVRADNPGVYNLVENLCLTAGLPSPKIYLIPDRAINAFATGRDPDHATIAITQGAIEQLSKDELEGVIAHELSHIKNYDIRLMTIVIVCVGIVTLLTNWLLRGRAYRSNNQRNDNAGQIGGILLLVGLILTILSPLFAQLIQLAVSRRREYLADASGALLTRYPEGLASALEKIKAQSKPLIRANEATAHLYISNPWLGTKKFWGNAFSTHPPLEDRIAKLRHMA